MAIAFSRSLRSLQADSWRAPLLGLLTGIALMAIWLGWFFLASVNFSETGRMLNADENGFLIGEFSLTSVARLKRGQTALIRLDRDTDAAEDSNRAPVMQPPVHAIVTEVNPIDLPPGQVRFAVPPGQPVSLPSGLPDEPPVPLAASVEVIVKRLSPARLVLQHIGLAQSDNDV